MLSSVSDSRSDELLDRGHGPCSTGLEQNSEVGGAIGR
jgi:hypothetical protein